MEEVTGVTGPAGLDEAPRQAPQAAGVPKRLTRAQAKARTRERLLDAAAGLFARKGFAATGVEEIAAAAGYTVGAVYSNFAGKEQLFLELLSTRVGDRIGSVAALMETAGQGGADPLDDLSQMLARAAGRNTGFAALQAEFWLHALRNPEVMEALAGQWRDQVDRLEQLVGAAMRQRGAGAPGVSARAVTIVVLTLFQGLVRQRLMDPGSAPPELFGQAVRWMLAGLRAQAATGAEAGAGAGAGAEAGAGAGIP